MKQILILIIFLGGNPLIAGQLWNDGGTVKVSAGV